APAKTNKIKGIDLLPEAALFEEVHVKIFLREADGKQLFIKHVAQVMELVFNQRFLMSQKAKLYGDVNVKLTDAEHNDKEKGDADMTDAAHVQVEQTQEQTMGVQEESGLEMASIQVVTMLDINVQHEILRTSLLLTIPVSVIPEHIVFNPSETFTTTQATTITSFLSPLFPSLQQSIPMLTPINTDATTSTIIVPESKTLSTLHQRNANLEKDVKELKNVDNSATVVSKIKYEVPNVVKEYLGSSLDDALYKVIQKH
nr:hypothetical protein [Tanacetum cinerariifolium]